jgi:nucleoside-diphosphate-sugar epimerase
MEAYLMRKNIVICGAGGFIGHYAVNRLKREGCYVTGIDRKYPEFQPTSADQFIIQDLRDAEATVEIFHPGNMRSVDECWQFAAEMGGAAYIFTGDNDADIMRNSALINLNILEACRRAKVGKVFFASSACVYPDYVQLNPDHCELHEAMAYPARPDSNYGWEKLFSERLYQAYASNHGMDIRIGRLHNVFGPLCTYTGGREKAPAAICRKVAETPNGGIIDIFGDGEQTRSFLYVDEAVEGIRRLMEFDLTKPVNIGSSEMVTINELVNMTCNIAGKTLRVNHIEGPQGVRGRTSNNDLIKAKLGWAPSAPLKAGLEKTYGWIESEVMRNSTKFRGPANKNEPLSAVPGGA